MAFYIWLLHLSIKFYIIRDVAWIGTSFLCMAEWYSMVCLHHVLFTHSSLDGHSSYCRLSATTNSAAVTFMGKLLLELFVFSSFGWTRRSGIAGSFNSMLNFVRRCHTVPQDPHHFTLLPTRARASVSSHSHQHWLLSIFILLQPFWWVWSAVSSWFRFALPSWHWAFFHTFFGHLLHLHFILFICLYSFFFK